MTSPLKGDILVVNNDFIVLKWHALQSWLLITFFLITLWERSVLNYNGDVGCFHSINIYRLLLMCKAPSRSAPPNGNMMWAAHASHTCNLKIPSSHVKEVKKKKKLGKLILAIYFIRPNIAKILSRHVININLLMWHFTFFWDWGFAIWCVFNTPWLEVEACSLATCGLWLPYWAVKF